MLGLDIDAEGLARLQRHEVERRLKRVAGEAVLRGAGGHVVVADHHDGAVVEAGDLVLQHFAVVVDADCAGLHDDRYNERPYRGGEGGLGRQLQGRLGGLLVRGQHPEEGLLAAGVAGMPKVICSMP